MVKRVKLPLSFYAPLSVTWPVASFRVRITLASRLCALGRIALDAVVRAVVRVVLAGNWIVRTLDSVVFSEFVRASRSRAGQP
jgi:hypothetical protein